MDHNGFTGTEVGWLVMQTQGAGKCFLSEESRVPGTRQRHQELHNEDNSRPELSPPQDSEDYHQEERWVGGTMILILMK